MSENLRESVKAQRARLRDAGMFDFPTPWIERTSERLATHQFDMFADYDAWEKWMLDRVTFPCIEATDAGKTCHCSNCTLARWWDETELPQRAILYATMSDACRHTAEACGWKNCVAAERTAEETTG